MSRRQEVFDLRIAYLAFYLHRRLATSNELYLELEIEHAVQDEFLKGYGRSEWEEARDMLLQFNPKPLARGVRPGLIAITDDGKEKPSADVLSELIQQQYRMSRRPVAAASNWQLLVNIASFFLVGSGIAFIAIPPFYLSSENILAAFDPWPAKFAAMVGLVSFLVLLGSADQCNKHWFSNEQAVASVFYDSYLHYRNFVRDCKADASLKQARKLVQQAATRMQNVVKKPRWEILGEDLERISETGKNVENLLLPSLEDHGGSAERAELMISLARCFLEKTRDSMKMALSQSAKVKPPPTDLQAPGPRWALSSYLGRSHPKTTGCATGLVVAACVLLAYVAYAYGSHESIVPGAAAFASVTASGLTAGFSTYLALRRSG